MSSPPLPSPAALVNKQQPALLQNILSNSVHPIFMDLRCPPCLFGIPVAFLFAFKHGCQQAESTAPKGQAAGKKNLEKISQ